MKYYKITLDKNPKGLVYPENYQSEVGDKAVDHLYWDEGQQTYLLLLIPDTEKDIIRKGIEEITEIDAKSISTTNETKTEVVVDEVKLRRIELKAQLGQTLTKDELDATDITKPTSVFGTTKILAERIDIIKTK
jgi:hypothetical protein